MSDDLGWVADAWNGANNQNASDLYITCARGLSPQQLAQRMADHEPVEVLSARTAQQATRMVDLAQTWCVGRIGQSGDWSFMVESGGSEGWALDPAVSLGAEVLIFDPRPDDPPSFFMYFVDGTLQLRFEPGAGYDPTGEQPGLLRPALEEAGVIPAEDSLDEWLGPDEELPPQDQRRQALQVIGEHFGLTLPRHAIESGQLPAVVTRTSPPRSW